MEPRTLLPLLPVLPELPVLELEGIASAFAMRRWFTDRPLSACVLSVVNQCQSEKLRPLVWCKCLTAPEMHKFLVISCSCLAKSAMITHRSLCVCGIL